jgi:hypothetical protein
MKIDGAEIARAEARKKKNMDLEKEGHESNKEQEMEGSHIKAMASFIEAIHHKDPEAAHMHISEYARHMSQMDVKKEI